MTFSAPSKLYFAAAALFIVAAAIGFFDAGVEVKTGAGLTMAGLMLALGLKARRRKP